MRMIRFRRFGLGTLLALLGACGSSKGGPAHDAGSPDVDPFPPCVPDGNAISVNGSYGVLATMNVHAVVANLVSTDAVAKVLLLDSATQSGTNVSVTAQVCDIELPPIQPQGFSNPIIFTPGPGLLQSIGSVSGGATLSGTTTCAGFASLPITMVIGAKLANLATDPLPMPDPSTQDVALCGGGTTMCTTSPDTCNFADGVLCSSAAGAACACDQEGDMRVGATLLGMNVPGDISKAFVALRTSFSLSGTVYSSQKILGVVKLDDFEQSTLGCMINLNDGRGDLPCGPGRLKNAAALNPTITQNPSGSVFEAVAVPATTTCAMLKSMEGTLF